jgi:DNA-directed RNA polymerase I, II, and III subunit RPABC2
MPPKKSTEDGLDLDVDSDGDISDDSDLVDIETDIESDNEESESESESEPDSESENAEKDDSSLSDDDKKSATSGSDTDSDADNSDTDAVDADDTVASQTAADCVYKKSHKKKRAKKIEEETLEVFSDDELPVSADKQRITKPFLTKYERVRVICTRSSQLLRGAKRMVKGTAGMTPQNIAQKELELGVMPLIIVRPMPDGSKEKWRVNELAIIN